MGLAKRLDEGASEPHAKAVTANPPAQPEPTAPISATATVTTPANNTRLSSAAPPPTSASSSLSKDDFQVIVPAFVTSQLKEAFETGFLIFIPFVIIDMVIANILLAMGMSMLSPSVISLPFKLLLFVLVDGWFLIIRGLVLSYV